MLEYLRLAYFAIVGLLVGGLGPYRPGIYLVGSWYSS